MKNTKFNLFLMTLMLCNAYSYAQINTFDTKQKKRMENKVEMFSSVEKDSIQLWFYNQTHKLGLSPKVRDEYSQILTDNVFDMRRVNDKDKMYTRKEQLEQLELISNKINTSVKPLLNDNQYKKHLANYEEVYDLIIKKFNKEE